MLFKKLGAALDASIENQSSGPQTLFGFRGIRADRFRRPSGGFRRDAPTGAGWAASMILILVVH